MAYRRCIVHLTIDCVRAMGGEDAAWVMKRKAKHFFGVNNLDGISDVEQIQKMNQFWKTTLETVPNTTFIRSWLVPCDNVDEYVQLFYQNWCRDVLASGVLQK